MSARNSRHFGWGRGRVPPRLVEDNREYHERVKREGDRVSPEVEQSQPAEIVVAPEINGTDDELRRLDAWLYEPLPRFIPPGRRVSSRGVFSRGDGLNMRHNMNRDQNRMKKRNYNDEITRDFSATCSDNQEVRVLPTPLLESNKTGSIENKTCEHELVSAHYFCDPSKPAFRLCIKCFGTPCAIDCESCLDADKKDVVKKVTDEPNKENNLEKGSRSQRHRRHPKSTTKPTSGLFGAPSSFSFQESILLAKQEEEEIERLKCVTFQTSKRPQEEASGREVQNIYLDEPQVPEQTDNFQNYLKGIQNQQFNGEGIDVPRQLAAGIPLTVKIVDVIEPACIFVQTEQQRRMIHTLKAKLKNQELRKLGMDDIFEGKYMVVVHEEEFYRAQIEAIDTKLRQFRVRLVDCAATFVKPLRTAYELPIEMTKINRQIVSMNTAGITTTNSKQWKQEICKYLKNRLVGEIVQIKITHGLACLPCHYYGSMTLCNKTMTISEELIKKRLANEAQDDTDILQDLVMPQFEDFQPPVFKTNEESNVRIIHVVSPEEFYVRKQNSINVEKLMRDFACTETLTAYSEAGHDGTKMCVTSHPQREGELARASCKQIDFMVDPAIATVYLIDLGITCQVPLNNLSEYHISMEAFPAQAYRVRIAVKPAYIDWSETTESLKEIMKQNENGREVTLTCVGKVQNWSIVRMHVDGCSRTWEEGLKQIGTAINLPKSITKNDPFAPINVSADPTIELLKFRQTTCALTECSKQNCSRFSFTNIPPAVTLTEGTIVETRRFRGVYLYLLMTVHTFKIHKKLRQYCTDFVETGNAEPGDYKFVIGDVVLGRWGPKFYQRCCITDFEEIKGVQYAMLTAFDIEQTAKVPVSELKCPNDFIMRTEKLGHVVWLEGTSEKTLVFSKDFAKYIAPYCQQTTIKKLTLLKGSGNKWMVRLETSPEKMLLSYLIKKFTQWNWERYFNAGFLTESRLNKKLYAVTNFKWDPNEFRQEGGTMPKGTHMVQLRQTILDDEHPHFIAIEVIPMSVVIKNDFDLLKFQMKNFYDKVVLNNENPSPDSPTYPNMVLIRETEDAKARHKLRSPCEGHRCFYNTRDEVFKCVDCFQETKVNGTWDPDELRNSRGLDIREICPEMLKISPIGKRFLVKLPLPHTMSAVKNCILQFLIPGREVEVRIAPQELESEQKILHCKTLAILNELMEKLKQLRLPR